MTVAHLAAEGAAYEAGRLLFSLGGPAIGLVCLVVGLVERARSRRRPLAYPQYPPSFPVNPGYPFPPPGYRAPPYPAYPGYAPGSAPRPRTPKSATILITIGAVLLVLGIFGNAARVLIGHRADALLRVGQCITESDYAADHFDVPANGGCANPANTYELAFKGGASESCPDGKREHSIYERTSNHSTLLCFMINLRQDQCYQVIRDGKAVSMKPDDCNKSSPMHVRVSQRIDGSSDKTRCPPDSKGIAYPVPARVYCVARAD
ncbi:hypothetical protein [Mycobacterium marseillense]|uniref:Uncharacterized protein n=1 Tax=Mycobacterium marseillense TaxID=701042 RepID=A0ABN5ZWY4_9MYCO|nr:hypothetical protein [Mycobacterium marseillense]MCA2263604.1 hypothetical protein [Mycobacterium marseillense]MCV7405093.1 hypothetical protein [Mycobacterium marseillense]OBJ69590.1 hypothetical protein A5626_06080 [Mycobacterium marseillense]ORA90457.1 hypothetical protein BST31_16490 [Mycobacterium marseillense]BBY13251.1 hypothetical protein MMARJ_39910 [Mycobacterium marseillense]